MKSKRWMTLSLVCQVIVLGALVVLVLSLLARTGTIEHVRGVVYANVDGKDLKLDILRPKQPPRRPMPVLVFIHSGSWKGGTRMNHFDKMIPFAQNGYVAVTIDYRLNDEPRYIPGQLEDCRAAIRYLRENAAMLHIDPERIGVWGFSAGGHLAALLAAGGDVEAVCVWHAPSRGDLFVEGEGDKGDVAQHIELGTPIPPFLIMHGDRDKRVPISEAVRMRQALSPSPVKMVTLKGAGHGGEAWQDEGVLDQVKAFFDEHLK